MGGVYSSFLFYPEKSSEEWCYKLRWLKEYDLHKIRPFQSPLRLFTKDYMHSPRKRTSKNNKNPRPSIKFNKNTVLSEDKMNCFCGIADMRGTTLDFERLRAMRGTMIQRGATRTEAYIEKGVGLLCSQELPIMQGGSALPYLISLQNGTLAVALDGEIVFLSDILAVKPLGIDTPRALAECYLAFGCDTPLEINGEYSFVAIDSLRRELFLATDAEGSRPIFYYKENERLIFSNSIRPLLSYSTRAAEVDKSAISELLRAPAGRVKACDIYKNISELKGGHFLICSGLGTSIHEYASKKRTISSQKNPTEDEKLITLTPDRAAPLRSDSEEMLFCFDYPEFDEYSPEYLSAVRSLKRYSRTPSRFYIEELSPCTDNIFANLKADRIGRAYGIKLSPKIPNRKPPRSRAFLFDREKKLFAIVKDILSSEQSHIKRFFGSSIETIVSCECETREKISTLGKIIGLERWLESYPIIPT